MGSRNPIRKRPPTVAEQVADLGCIDEIDELLEEGTSATDVAKFIQQTLNELTEFGEATLVKVLRKRRADNAAAGPKMYSPAEEAPQTPRAPSSLAYGAYTRQSRGIDSLIELESLYLSCRDRIGWLMDIEQKPRGSGEHRAIRPIEKMHLEYQAAKDLIKEHARLQSELGMTTQDRFKLTLDVQGMRSKFGATIATVLADPEGRHKVLSLLDRLKGAGSLPADVIDVPAAAGGE